MTAEQSVSQEFGTIKVICKEFDVSRSYLESLEKKGIINFYRLGGKVFIKRNEIKRALEESCKGCK